MNKMQLYNYRNLLTKPLIEGNSVRFRERSEGAMAENENWLTTGKIQSFAW